MLPVLLPVYLLMSISIPMLDPASYSKHWIITSMACGPLVSYRAVKCCYQNQILILFPSLMVQFSVFLITLSALMLHTFLQTSSSCTFPLGGGLLLEPVRSNYGRWDSGGSRYTAVLSHIHHHPGEGRLRGANAHPGDQVWEGGEGRVERMEGYIWTAASQGNIVPHIACAGCNITIFTYWSCA